LSAPIEVLDDHMTTRDAMLSESVLVLDGSRIAFFHESFFDYAFARTFARQDKTLCEWLLATEQSLFRRSQVIQILEYRRDSNRDAYLADLACLLSDDRVRPHVRTRVREWLQGLRDPSPQEWQLIEDLARNSPEAEANDLLGLVRNSPAWFTVLLENGTWQDWLSSDSDKEIDRAVTLLAMPDVQRECGDDVSRLLRPYVGRSEYWSNRLRFVMSRISFYSTEGLQEMFLELLDRGELDDARPGIAVNDDFWSLLYGAATARPPFTARAIGHFLGRWVARFREQREGSLFDAVQHSQSSGHVIHESANRDPDEFLKDLFPRVLDIADEFGDAVWPRISGTGHQWDEQILSELEHALRDIAVSSPELLDSLLSLRSKPSRTFSYLALRAWSANARRYAQKIVDHLLEDPERLEIEYMISLGGESASIAAQAVATSSELVNDETYERLEAAILHHTPEHEKLADFRDHRGLTQYRLLSKLPAGRLSPTATRTVAELGRKFGGAGETTPGMRMFGGGWVGSPLPASALDHMTDEQIVGAMQGHAVDRTSFRGDEIVGGAIELSQQIGGFIKLHPERATALIDGMPEDLNSHYFDGILDGFVDGLADKSEEVTDAQRDIAWGIVRRLHALNDRPCGHSITKAVLKLASGPLPNDILGITGWYAANVKDDVEDQAEDGESQSDLWFFGSIRENAAWTLAAILAYHPDSLEILVPVLEALSRDPSFKVRATAAHTFKYAARVDTSRGIGWFLSAMEGSDRYWGAAPVEDFLHTAVARDYEAIRPFLQRMASSAKTKAVRAAARQICIAGLNLEEAAEDAAAMRTGTESQRLAAAEVYATNVSAERVAEECGRHLAAFFHDESQSVRAEAARCFHSMAPDDLGKGNGLVEALIDSPAFLEGVEFVAFRLENATELPCGLLARIARKAAEEMGPGASDIRTAESAKAYVISKIVLRAYNECEDTQEREQLLSAIDLMAQKHFLGLDGLDSLPR